MKTLMNNIPASIWVTDNNLRYTMQNTENIKRWGNSIGKHVEDMDVPKEHKKKWVQLDKEVLKGEIIHDEYQISYAGKIHHYDNLIAPVRKEGGKIIGSIGISREVTEQKRMETELKRSEEKFRLILNSTGSGIYGIDLNGMCTFMNPAGLNLLGYRKENELIGKELHQIIHHTKPDGSPYPSNECKAYQAYRQGKGEHLDNEIFWKKDGSSFLVEYHSYPVLDEKKNVKGAVVSFNDVTERRKMEEELKEHRNFLEKMVKERTSELKKAKDLIEKENQAKSMFLSKINQEISFPMQMIMNNISLGIENLKFEKYEETKDNLSTLMTGAEKLLQIIFELTRFESKRIEQKKGEYDFSEITKEAIDIFRFLAEEKKITIDYNSKTSHNIEIDKNKMIQAIGILFIESIKLAPTKSTIQFNLSIDHNSLILSISTTDVCLTKKESNRIITDIQKQKNEANSEMHLSFANEAIEAHNGKLYLKNDDSDELTFIVKLYNMKL